MTNMHQKGCTLAKTMITLMLLLLAMVHRATSCTLDDRAMLVRYQNWMAEHGRVYTNDEEKQLRFQVFKDNVALIDAHNGNPDKGFTLAVNKFTDLTNNEIRASYNGYKRAPSRVVSGSFRYANVSAVEDEVDWRKNGAVTPIKHQGACGKFFFSFSV